MSNSLGPTAAHPLLPESAPAIRIALAPGQTNVVLGSYRLPAATIAHLQGATERSVVVVRWEINFAGVAAPFREMKPSNQPATEVGHFTIDLADCFADL